MQKKLCDNKLTERRKNELNRDYTIYAKWKKIFVPAPKITSIRNPIAGKLTVKYSKAGEASGYEIALSADKRFSSSTTITAVSQSSSKTVTGLKPGAAYYVRVRAYKYDSAGSKVFGSFGPGKRGYAIQYILRGGRNNRGNLIRYYKSSVRLKSPSRRGYSFRGWYLNKKCTKRIRTISKIRRSNCTIYAKWQKKKRGGRTGADTCR